jgi:hypothetical protein
MHLDELYRLEPKLTRFDFYFLRYDRIYYWYYVRLILKGFFGKFFFLDIKTFFLLSR